MATPLSSSKEKFDFRAYPEVSPMKTSSNSNSKEIVLTLGQVIVSWAVIAGLMVMVFLFGFFAGKDQGLKVALDQGASQAVRLPLPALAKLEQPEATQPSSAAELARPGTAEPQVSSRSTEATFDFAASSVSHAKVGEPAKPNESAPAPAQAAPAGSAVSSSGGEPRATSPAGTQSGTAAVSDRHSAGFAQKGAVESLNSLSDETAQLAEKEQKSLGSKVGEEKKPEQAKSTVEKKKDTATAQAAQSVKTTAKQPPQTLSKETPKDTVPVVSNVPPGWYVQLMATETKTESDQLMSGLRSRGFAARGQQAQVGAKTWFRVLSGPYSTMDEAVAAQKSIKGMKLSGGVPFVRRMN